MDNWFYNIIPCCSKSRQKITENQDSNYFRSKSNYDEISYKIEQDIEMNEIRDADAKDKMQSFGKSLSADYIQEYNYIVCAKCQSKATGFCIACPGKRYCKVCFDLEHATEIEIHKFRTYDNYKKQVDPLSLKHALNLNKNIKDFVDKLSSN